MPPKKVFPKQKRIPARREIEVPKNEIKFGLTLFSERNLERGTKILRNFSLILLGVIESVIPNLTP